MPSLDIDLGLVLFLRVLVWIFLFVRLVGFFPC